MNLLGFVLLIGFSTILRAATEATSAAPRGLWWSSRGGQRLGGLLAESHAEAPMVWKMVVVEGWSHQKTRGMLELVMFFFGGFEML